jgi:6-phospho-3-hexuloisomerase
MDKFILAEAIQAELCYIPSTHYDDVLKIFNEHKRIVLAGAGRSRLVANMFAMRLMHCGKSVYLVGDVTTPSIQADDVLVVISNSGETQQLVGFVKKAKEVGAKVVVITSKVDSTIAVNSDTVLHINVAKNAFPLGTLFEMTVLTFLETCISYIIMKNDIDMNELKQRHANLE